MRRVAAVLMLCLMALAVFGGGAGAAAPGGHIAYDSGVDIWLSPPDGGAAVNLTESATYNAMPSWSPDGKQIVFYSNRDPEGNSEIYVMEADGSRQTRLTRSEGMINANPEWSPAGGAVVFHSTRDGNSEVYVMTPDGAGQTNLTRNEAEDKNPRWSPDGKRIAFLSTRDDTSLGLGHEQLWVMAADGSGLKQLTEDRVNLDWTETNILFDWSPDGTQILFTCGDPDDPNNVDRYDLCVVPSSGTSDGSDAPHTLAGAELNAMETDPVYSLDGLRIAFKTNRDGNEEIYAANADGSQPVNVTNDPGDDAYPAWSPDGKRIAFQSNRTGTWEIYVTDVDGTAAMRISHTEQGAFAPVWTKW